VTIPAAPGPWANEWRDLPVIQYKAVMDDEDTMFWGDLLYLRGMLDDIVSDAAVVWKRITTGTYTAEDLFWIRFLQGHVEWFPHWELTFSDPWPVDEAEQMLEAWRNEEEGLAA